MYLKVQWVSNSEQTAMFDIINSVFDEYTTYWNSIDRISASKVFSHEV